MTDQPQPTSPSDPLGLYPPHEQLITDAHTPDWQSIDGAQNHLAQAGHDGAIALQDLWAQNEARDREIARLTAELQKARSSAFREAARLLESTSRDGDAVNLLDNVADGITTHTLNPAADPWVWKPAQF